jgi:hypothetical protein
MIAAGCAASQALSRAPNSPYLLASKRGRISHQTYPPLPVFKNLTDSIRPTCYQLKMPHRTPLSVDLIPANMHQY